jgi:hypothetical protein
MHFCITREGSRTVSKIAAQRGDCLAAQFDAISDHTQMQPSAAGGGLVGDDLLLAEARDPVRS